MLLKTKIKHDNPRHSIGFAFGGLDRNCDDLNCSIGALMDHKESIPVYGSHSSNM